MYKLILIIFSSWISLSFATNYYIDTNHPNANDNNPGTEVLPFKTIQKGVDVAFAGDTVFIKAGTYVIGDGELEMKRSGTSSQPIVFKNFENDYVLLDMTLDTDKGWWWGDDYQNNIIIDGLNFKNGAWPITIQGSYNQIKNCTLFGASLNPINVWGGSHNLISKNIVYDYYWNGVGIESRPNDGDKGRADSNIVEYNHIYNSSSHMGVNIFPKTGQAQNLMYGNVIRFNKIHDVNESGIYLRRQVDAKIYGNLIYNCGNWGIFFHWRNSSNGVHTSNVDVFNNTIVENTYSGIKNQSHNSMTIKNNIFYNHSVDDSKYEVQISSTIDIGSLVLDNNLYYASSASLEIIYWGGAKKTLQQTQNDLGQEMHGKFGDPLFFDLSNNVFTLNELSPAIDMGEDLGAPFDNDIEGVLRPQGNGWDNGVYESISGPDSTLPEVTGAVLLDSITLVINFTEPLEESGAENTNNYSIAPNVDVFDASLSGANVTLTTDVHTPGLYSVTVSNVKDLAGNTISPSANSADYEWEDDPLLIYTQFTIVEATASSVPQPEHSPDKTIDGKGYYDGDPSSRWAAEPMPEWIMFDLGDVYSVSMTKFSFYRWNEGRIYNYSILGSIDASNWQNILTNVNSSSEEWTIEEFDPIEVRYIRVVHNSSNQNDWAGLWEGEIWGENLTTEITSEILPHEFELYQNYPNPFNPSTKIKFTVPEKGNVVLKVFNLIGQEVAELVNSEMENGVYEIDFNASGFASGVYFYRMIAGNFVDTKKMILLQ